MDKEHIIFGFITLALVGVMSYIFYFQFFGISERTQVEIESDPESEIVVSDLEAGTLVTSPLEFSGYADESWFEDGEFVVTMRDEEGKILGEGIATAGDSSAGTVPNRYRSFTVQMPFTPSSAGDGVVVLEKSNPTGDAEYAFSYGISVTFSAPEIVSEPFIE